jgi:multisubunit Na+/H+ antiporter MnhF subunit
MKELVLNAGFLGLVLAIGLALWRLWRGPSVIDRILAFDAITTCAVGMVVLLSIRWDSAMYLELVLAFSLLGFFSTVAFVFHLHRRRQTEGGAAPEEPVAPRSPDA